MSVPSLGHCSPPDVDVGWSRGVGGPGPVIPSIQQSGVMLSLVPAIIKWCQESLMIFLRSKTKSLDSFSGTFDH